jgi:hypothetical protein
MNLFEVDYVLYLIIFVIFYILYRWIKNSGTVETMISSLYMSVIVPEMCYNYFISDGVKYYLINTHKLYDGISNPRIFNTLALANAYLKDNKCEPLELNRFNTGIKSNVNETEFIEKLCSHEVATARNRIDMCNAYGDNVELKDLQKDIDMNVAKYNIEECMIKKVGDVDVELRNPFEDDLKFEFARYANEADEYNILE